MVYPSHHGGVSSRASRQRRQLPLPQLSIAEGQSLASSARLMTRLRATPDAVVEAGQYWRGETGAGVHCGPIGVAAVLRGIPSYERMTGLPHGWRNHRSPRNEGKPCPLSKRNWPDGERLDEMTVAKLEVHVGCLGQADYAARSTRRTRRGQRCRACTTSETTGPSPPSSNDRSQPPDDVDLVCTPLANI
ncbi:hypothetical protein P7C73_g4347, partial [Tremellales sp. Uapishka_1]